MYSNKLLIPCLLFASVSTPALKAMVGIEKHAFNIEQTNLPKALLHFAQQARVSVALPPLSFHDGQSKSVSGQYTITKALEKLLTDTGYTFVVVSERAIRIEKAPKRTPIPNTTTDFDLFTPPAIQEILVSATRRTDHLQRLPYSISVVRSPKIAERGTNKTWDIGRKTAGVFVTSRRVGEGKLVIRGLSDGAFSGRVQSLVNTYMDYARLNYNAPDPDLILNDIDRIEILRGPQGTLYGSGSLGGLYRVVSHEPSTTDASFITSSTFAATQQGTPSIAASAIMNLPLLRDKAGIRSLTYYQHDGGYIDDLKLNQTNVNTARTIGGQLALLLSPFDTSSLKLTFRHQDHNARDSSYIETGAPQLTRNNYIQEPRNDRLNQYEVVFKMDMDWADLTSSASWLHRKINATYDASTMIPLFIGLDPVASPYSTNRHIRSFTNETHLASTRGERFEWLVGTFYSQRSEAIFSELIVSGAGELPLFSGSDSVYDETLQDKLKEYAVFGEATYYLTQNLSFTAGARAFHYNDTATSLIRDIGTLNPYEVDGSQKKSGLTPKFVLSYMPNDIHMVYAQIAEGYRLGGVNLAGFTAIDDVSVLESPATGESSTNTIVIKLDNFASDDLMNYEMGWKAKLWNGRLNINSAVFYAKWKQIQSNQFGYNGLPEIANVGDARLYGFEIEANLKAGEQTSINAHLSWADSKITQTTQEFGARIGNTLPGAPKHSGGITVEHGFELFSLPVFISGSYSYVSSANILFEESDRYRTDPSHLLNSHLSLSKGPWRFNFFIKNIFNSKANIFAFSNPFHQETGINTSQPKTEPKPVEAANFSHSEVTMDHPYDSATPLYKTTPRPRTLGISISWSF